MRSWIFVPPLSGRATCLARDGSIRIFYIPSLLVENSFVSPVSRDYQSVTLLELETPNTSTFNTIKAESFNVKWKKEERCDAKTTEQMLVIDTPKSSGTIFSLDVIQFPFLFSTHIDPQSISNEQNTDQGLFYFVTFSLIWVSTF